MPLTYKEGNPKKCNICFISDISKFSTCIYDICKECKKNKNNKEYSCKYCNENNSDNFYKGRYSTCKKCRIISDKTILSEIKSQDKIVKNEIYISHLFLELLGVTSTK
jgi:hypothetical protein